MEIERHGEKMLDHPQTPRRTVQAGKERIIHTPISSRAEGYRTKSH